jgi:hypothetical protein
MWVFEAVCRMEHLVIFIAICHWSAHAQNSREVAEESWLSIESYTRVKLGIVSEQLYGGISVADRINVINDVTKWAAAAKLLQPTNLFYAGNKSTKLNHLLGDIARVVPTNQIIGWIYVPSIPLGSMLMQVITYLD